MSPGDVDRIRHDSIWKWCWIEFEKDEIIGIYRDLKVFLMKDFLITTIGCQHMIFRLSSGNFTMIFLQCHEKSAEIRMIYTDSDYNIVCEGSGADSCMCSVVRPRWVVAENVWQTSGMSFRNWHKFLYCFIIVRITSLEKSFRIFFNSTSQEDVQWRFSWSNIRIKIY